MPSIVLFRFVMYYQSNGGFIIRSLANASTEFACNCKYPLPINLNLRLIRSI
jgi:hypothetical protein